jgi:hypothetical protein
MLFPGFGCTGEVWNETVAELSKITNVIFLLCWIWECPSIETLGWLPSRSGHFYKTKKNKRMLH